MMKILYLLSMALLHLYGTCLEVGVTSGQSCSGNSVNIDSITQSFSSNMEITMGNYSLDIPLYVRSDSTDEITMTLTGLASLNNSVGADDIVMDYTFLNSSKNFIQTITDGQSFVLISIGGTASTGVRDGNTLVGYIRLATNSNLQALQTSGAYSLSLNTKVTTGGAGNDSDSITANATVSAVTMVSFSNNVSGQKTGESFVNSTVNFGTLSLGGSNSTTADVYLKNNVIKTNNRVTMSFTPVALKHETYPNNHEIGMNYSYTDGTTTTTITDNTPFILKTGKQSGSKVGTMTFTMDALPSTLLAGTYNASITVTIKAE